MDTPQQTYELVLPVTFGRGSFHAKQEHELALTGEGQIAIGADTVTLFAQERKSFSSARDTATTFSTARIANVLASDKQVQFSVYPPDVMTGTPQHVCVMHTQTAEDAELIRAALPGTIAEDVRQKAEDQTTFARLLYHATPKVFVTPTILGANVILFILMVVSGVDLFEPTNKGLLHWGADFGPLTMSGEWWRLISNVFVHIGIIHLALNMWVLSQIGPLVERLFGNALFIVVYLAAGIMGSIASVCTHPEIVAAGASGAIFGLYGALVGFSVRQRNAIPKTVLTNLRQSSIGFIGYNVFFGFTRTGIDNSAHLGGLFCGILLGFVAAMPLDAEIRKTRLAKRILLTLVTFLALVAISARFIPQSSYSGYVKFTELFLAEESKAIDAYNEIMAAAKKDGLSDETLASKLEAECLARWDVVCEAGKKTSLPKASAFQPQYELYVKIASLRAQSLRKMTQALRKNDDKLFNEGMQIQEEANSLGK